MELSPIEVVLGVLGLLILTFSGISIFGYMVTYIPKKVRTRELESLAKEYGLNFSAKSGLKRNYLSGIINGAQIEIFDADSIKVLAHMGPGRAVPISTEVTTFNVNGKENLMQGYVSNLGSVHDIRKDLAFLKNQ